MRIQRWKLVTSVLVVTAPAVTLGVLTPTLAGAARSEPGGHLQAGGELYAMSANPGHDDPWAWFDLYAAESPRPQFVANGHFDEGTDPWGTDDCSELSVFFPEDDPAHHFQDTPTARLSGSCIEDMPDPDPDIVYGTTTQCVGTVDPGVLYDMRYWAWPQDDSQHEFTYRFFGGENCDGPLLDEYTLFDPGGQPDWTPFEVTDVAAPAPEESPLSLSVSFTTVDPDGSGSPVLFLDAVEVVRGSDWVGEAGRGDMSLRFGAANIDICDAHGPGMEQGTTPLAEFECGGSGNISVAVDACTAELETHGIIHADHPWTVYFGPVTLDVNFQYQPRRGYGTLKLDVHTPKDTMQLMGRYYGEVDMPTCG